MDNIINHADIVMTHECNMHCKFCIDSLRGTSNNITQLKDIEAFLQLLRRNTTEKISILLLGGEPTMVPTKYLIQVANLVHNYGFKIIMSTNGQKRDEIIELTKYFDSIQITMHSDKEIDFWRPYGKYINAKLSGDANFTMASFKHFMEVTGNDFYRRSVTMYFKPDFEELCKDKEIWALLDTLEWTRISTYEYAFYEGVRFKRCVHGQTNIMDEPLIPKLYPNGNYNKTWLNELPENYLGNCGK